MNASIEEKVISVLTDILKVKKDEVRMESSIRTDLGADSMDVVALLMALEESLNVQISDEEAKELVTVGDAVRFITAKTGA